MPALVWARTRWKPYKNTIDRWLWPDVFRRQDTSVSKAKQAISKYKKALGDPEGVAELMVFYCERAAGFCTDVGHEDAGYFDALVRMFEQALKTTNILAPSTRIAPARGKPSSPARLSLQSAMTATTLFPNIVRGYVVAEHNPVRSSKPARPLVTCRWLSTAVKQMAKDAGRDPASLAMVVRANLEITDKPLGDKRTIFSGTIRADQRRHCRMQADWSA